MAPALEHTAKLLVWACCCVLRPAVAPSAVNIVHIVADDVHSLKPIFRHQACLPGLELSGRLCHVLPAMMRLCVRCVAGIQRRMAYERRRKRAGQRVHADTVDQSFDERRNQTHCVPHIQGMCSVEGSDYDRSVSVGYWLL